MMIDPFPLLLAGHAVGDWIVQTDWQAFYKARPDCWPAPAQASTAEQRKKSWSANQTHMLTYHGTVLAFLLPWVISLHGGRVVAMFAAIGFSWAAHSLIDRRWPVRWLLERTGSRRFAGTPLGMLAADQALHIATLAVMAAWLQAVLG